MSYNQVMTERQQAILVAIIEQYAEIAAPVGSVTLAKLFGVSSATIRSEMAKLRRWASSRRHTPALAGFPQIKDTVCMSMVLLTLR